jgi:hypothetical protein
LLFVFPAKLDEQLGLAAAAKPLRISSRFDATEKGNSRL